MSLDKSLKSHGALVRHRNVLSRAERLEKLKDAGKWKDGDTVFGLPKVAHRKVVTKKIKAAPVPGAEGAEAAAGAAVPAAGAAAPAAAGKTPAVAAKAAAAPAKAAAPKAAGGKGKA
jgi:small basic protein (TIGR04137 family)